MDATVTFAGLLVMTTPTFLLAFIACAVGSCNRRELAQQRREIAGLRNAMYVPQAQPQYYSPPTPQPSAPVVWA